MHCCTLSLSFLSLKHIRYDFLKATCHLMTVYIILTKAACIQLSDFYTEPPHQAHREKCTLSNYWLAHITSAKYRQIDITWPCFITSFQHVTHQSHCNWYALGLAHLSLYYSLTTFSVSIFTNLISCIINNTQQIRLKYKTIHSIDICLKKRRELGELLFTCLQQRQIQTITIHWWH